MTKFELRLRSVELALQMAPCTVAGEVVGRAKVFEDHLLKEWTKETPTKPKGRKGKKDEDSGSMV